MEQLELFNYLIAVLERLSLQYFVTGSLASSHFGEPRFTNDIDVVVIFPLNRVREFCDAFPSADFYVSEEAARDAVIRHSQFNILDPSSGLKIDVMCPESTPFNQSRFARRMQETGVWYAAPEDVILKKMEYFQMGGSDKHLRDIASMLLIQGDLIDRVYIANWATKLGLTEVWDLILARIQELRGQSTE